MLVHNLYSISLHAENGKFNGFDSVFNQSYLNVAIPSSGNSVSYTYVIVLTHSYFSIAI